MRPLQANAPDPGESFVIIPWKDSLTSADAIEHICGQECAAKALAKWMAAQ